MPEPEEIRNRASELLRDRDYTDQREEIEDNRRLLFGERAVKIDNVTPAVQWHSPEIELTSHKYARRALLAPMTIRVVSRKEGDRPEGLADKAERFFKAHDDGWRMEGIHDGPLFDQAALGIGTYRLGINREALPRLGKVSDSDPKNPGAYAKALSSYLSEKKGSIFTLEYADPATVAWARDGKEAVQAVRVDIRAAAAAYNKRIAISSGELEIFPPSTGDPVFGEGKSEGITLIIYEDGEYCYHFADLRGHHEKAKLLQVYPSYFGRPGFVRFAGDATGHPEPKYKYRPLVRGMYVSVPHENVMGTLKLNAGVRAAQMQYALRKATDDARVPEGGLHIKIIDQTLVPPPGWEIYSPSLDASFDVHEAFNMARLLTKEYGFPAVLDRPQEVKATAGYDRMLQQATVSNILDRPLDNWAEANRTIYLMMAKAVEEMPLPVVMRTTYQGERNPEAGHEIAEEISLGPKDVQDMDLLVSFDSTETYTRIALAEEGMKQREQGLKSWTEFQVEDRGVQDVQAVRRLHRRDKLREQAEQWALEDSIAAVAQRRAAVIGKEFAKAGIEPTEPAPEEVTASVPTGPNTARPIVPPVPEEVLALQGGQIT